MVDSQNDWAKLKSKSKNNAPEIKSTTPQPSFNLSSINKDNIFQSDVFSKLLKPNSAPEEPTTTKEEPLPVPNVNVQKTEQLVSFLGSLGIAIGGQQNPVIEEVKPKEPEPHYILARSLEGVYLVPEGESDFVGKPERLLCQDGSTAVYSPDGAAVAYVTLKAVGIYLFEQKKSLTIDLPNALAVQFSPGMKYLVATDKRDKDGKYYLNVYNFKTLKKIAEFETFKYKKEQWPHLKFTEDDKLVFRALKKTLIEVMSPLDNFKVINSIQTTEFDYFALSPKAENLQIITVSLEHSAGYEKNEGLINIFKYEDLSKPFMSEKTDKAHEITLFFSPTGEHLLVWAQTFTDKTNQSYYGEHILLYLDYDKRSFRKIPTYKGPIHDVAWNPNGKEFIVISGFMPAGSVLFDCLATPKFEFGKHHRNTIRWSPLSKYVCLAGYGNLSGDMEIWDAQNLKQVGTCKSNSAVTCQWSPDGRTIMTAVLNPRLRVDNNFKLFKYNGKLLSTSDFSKTELYEVAWRPVKYNETPASPVKERGDSKLTQDQDKPNGVEKERKLFRPKGEGNFAAQFKAEKQGSKGPRYLTPDETFGNNEEPEKELEAQKENFTVQKKTVKLVRAGDTSGDVQYDGNLLKPNTSI